MAFGRKLSEQKLFFGSCVLGRVLSLQQVSTQSPCWGVLQGDYIPVQCCQYETIPNKAAEKHGPCMWLLPHSRHVMTKCKQAAVRAPCAQSSGQELVSAALGGECKHCHGTISACLSLSLLFYQYRSGKATACSLLKLGHQIPCHLKLVFPGSQPCLTAFWLPSSLPERRGSQQPSHLLSLKPQYYSKETPFLQVLQHS